MEPAGLGLVFLLALGPSAACRSGGCCYEELPYPDADTDSSGPRDLSCYRVPGAGYECTWRYAGPAGAQHYLRSCLRRCCYFAVGSSTRVQFSDQDGVRVLDAVSLWVETRVANCTERSARVTLRLHGWVRYDPPRGDPRLLRASGRLRMEWSAADPEPAELQFRRRTPGSPWEVGDCGPAAGRRLRPGLTALPPPESCECPLEAAAAQEVQVRRRRLRSGAPDGPWSSWSDPVCVPPEELPKPAIWPSVEPLGPDGRRRLSLQGEPPPLELPAGCRGPAPVSYVVRLRMLSCPCQPRAARTLRLDRRPLLSAAAYNLTLVAQHRLGTLPGQSWHIPADTRTGPQNVSVDAHGTTLRWAAGAPGTTYCIEWRPLPDSSAAGCRLWAESAGTAVHSWSPGAGDLGQEQCYRVTVLASVRPQKPTAWSTVLATHVFGGNASRAGTPARVSLRTLGGGAVTVHWAPSVLGGCPGVLERYVVRLREDGGREWELPQDPALTELTLRGLPAGAYTVQVRADTAWLRGAWTQPQRFRLAQPRPAPVPVLAALGGFLGVVVLGVLGLRGLSRASRLLCPPLPTPRASSAAQLPSALGQQTWLWSSPADFPEEVYPQQALVVEMARDESEGLELPGGDAEPTLDTRGRHEAGVAGPPACRTLPTATPAGF
ncbi:interleukin-12 receptor subunit beta-1 [Lepus europaeus]|uniref:interleukin-12 receptor subunit beta-1 n=1 Tax=Lepus europaeus TaxID=9983 RepID=UPI002B4A83F1|nr:interleukin-12 receptor subunit beta-1 [Lepus europaeus]